MVFDIIVRPSLEDLRDLGPLVAVLLMRFEHDLLLLWGPCFLLDLGVEMIVPAALQHPYRSLHCLPVRVSTPYLDDIFSLISAQFLVPYFLTNATMARSSYIAQPLQNQTSFFDFITSHPNVIIIRLVYNACRSIDYLCLY